MHGYFHKICLYTELASQTEVQRQSEVSKHTPQLQDVGTSVKLLCSCSIKLPLAVGKR